MAEEEDEDPLGFDDDQALNEFLQDLDFNDDDDEWGIDPDAESQKVAALLGSLGEDAKRKLRPAIKPRDGTEHDDDDSEGEEMSREVENVLTQARDEAELAKRGAESESEDQDALPASRPPPPPSQDLPRDELGDDDGSATRKLPSPPSTPKANNPTDYTARAKGGDEEEDEEEEEAFALPTVPTELVDPAPEPQFETAIAARMAALKGISSDAFGLPSAPTFRPEDRASASASSSSGLPGLPKKRVGYSDDDQKTWCIVCLEDATVRCLGCDEGDNKYCGRCFRDMHVGPAAGFDERGHKWVKFER